VAVHSLARRGRMGGWGALFWVQVGFLAFHALRGWCPPLPLFRRLGFRSADEIGVEREVLHDALS